MHKSHFLSLTAVVMVSAAATARSLACQGTSPPAVGRIEGVVYDSVHARPLAGAIVMLDGATGTARSDASGRYRIDSVPAGSQRLMVSHALLDTIGFVLSSAPFTVSAGATTTMDLSTPSSARIVGSICRDARGPGALVGQVRDVSTNDAAAGARVQLVYDGIDLQTLKTVSVVREAVVDASGGYVICGLPAPLTAKAQVFRGAVTSGEVVAVVDTAGLGLRSFSIAARALTATIPDSASATRRVNRGLSSVSGRVLSKEGFAIEGARVTIAGSGVTALTNRRGEFRLDSLPAGTQSLEVRKLGYNVADQAMELADGVLAAAEVTMSPYTLAPVTIEAERDAGLSRIGYTDRKRSLNGYFLDGERIRRTAPHFSDIIRGATALKFMPTRDGHTAVVSSRDPNAGCVNFTVDGTHWKELRKGDIDDFVRPDEVRAIEVYNPESAPAKFDTGGQTKCVTVLVWTVRSVNRKQK